jgi:ABC-type uncharacterized transport system substrate-binding protein
VVDLAHRGAVIGLPSYGGLHRPSASCSTVGVALARVMAKPDIILTTSIPSTAALQRATRTIPIVFVGGTDPVASSRAHRLRTDRSRCMG